MLLNHVTGCTCYQDIRTLPDGTVCTTFKESPDSVQRYYRNLSYNQTVRNLSYDYFEFGICPTPEFGICPTIISSSESVLRLSSESVLRLFRVRNLSGLQWEYNFKTHSHRISVGIPTKPHTNPQRKHKNPHKKTPKNPKKTPQKPKETHTKTHWKTRNNRRTDSELRRRTDSAFPL